MSGDVTLDDVARRSGVSRATASRALNERDGVRPDVRERVKTIANALGYRPNRSAQNLAGGRASVLGLVIGGTEIRENPYATALVQEVAKASDRNNEGLLLLLETKEPSVAIRELLSDGIADGLIISVLATESRWVEEMLAAPLPSVLIGSAQIRTTVPVIEVENRESSADLVGRILDSGCRRVATITGRSDRLDAAQRLEGFRLAHERRSIEVDESLIVAGDFRRERAYELADDLLDRSPDAVFCANDDSAKGLYRRAIERGLSVPEDLSIAGFDGTTTNEFEQPVLTSVVQPFERMAERAVKTLVALIDGNPVPQLQVITPELFQGATTRPGAISSDEEGLESDRLATE